MSGTLVATLKLDGTKIIVTALRHGWRNWCWFGYWKDLRCRRSDGYVFMEVLFIHGEGTDLWSMAYGSQSWNTTFNPEYEPDGRIELNIELSSVSNT